MVVPTQAETGESGAHRDDPSERSLPLVSAVIPTHNRVESLSRALDSVLHQVGAGELFRLEVVVVDDASTDSTSHVVPSRYPEVRYVRLSGNLGASAARNAGIAASTGEYVAFLDDDDEWLPHRLCGQIPVLEENPEIGVVYGQGYISGAGFSDVLWPRTEQGVSGRVFEHFVLQDDQDVFNIDTVLIRRTALDRAGHFDENLRTMEHHDLMLRLAFHVPFRFISGPVSRGYAGNAGLFVSSITSGIYADSYVRTVEKALALLPEDCASSRLRREARRVAFSVVSEVYWKYGLVAYAREFTLEMLARHPWMLHEPPMRRNLIRLTRSIAADSTTPHASIASLVDQVGSLGRLEARGGHSAFARLRAALMVEGSIVLLRRRCIAEGCRVLLDSGQHGFRHLGARLKGSVVRRCGRIFRRPALRSVSN